MVADFPHKGATNLTPLFLHGAASADMTGWSAVLSALLDGLKDGLLSIPILFLAYLLMELLERSSRLNEGLLRRYSRRAGPALGGLLGIVPQCGISGAAATLFSTGSITVGTMLAVFFATSDEMLPILLSSLTESSGISWKTIVLITLSKAALGILLGYLADLLFGRWFRAQKSIHSFCEREHCDCDEEEGSVFLAALRHTLKIAAMLIAVNFALNLLFHYIGVERLSGTVLNRPVLGELILALFGLIPNCSVSVVVTESYLSGVLGLGGLFADGLHPLRMGVSECVDGDACKEIEIFIAVDIPDVGALTVVHHAQGRAKHVHMHLGVLSQPLGIFSAECFQLFSCHRNSSFQYRPRARPWCRCRRW